MTEGVLLVALLSASFVALFMYLTWRNDMTDETTRPDEDPETAPEPPTENAPESDEDEAEEGGEA